MVMIPLANRVRRSGNNVALKEQSSKWWNWGRYSPTHPAVDDMGALSLTAFYRGITLIASTLASLPLHVYLENDDGTKEVIKTPDTAYLWRRPNIEMTRQSFWERVIADEVRGNAFIYVKQDGDGLPESLWYIDRRRVRVGRNSDLMKVYEIDGERPMIDYKQGGEILHIPNWGDALVGYDPVALFQQAFALGLSAEEFAASSFANGAIPPGLITTEQTLTVQQADALKTRWMEQHAGIKNSQDVGFLGNGAKFQQLSVDHEKMQMEALRSFQVQEVARLLGLPPHLLGDVDHASQGGGNGMEEQNRALIAFTYLAHITRVEQAIDDCLLVEELTSRYIKMELDGLLRGSILQRYQAFALGYGRWLTADDIRELEDLPVIGGKAADLFAAVNLVPVEDLGKVPAGGPPGGRQTGGTN